MLVKGRLIAYAISGENSLPFCNKEIPSLPTERKLPDNHRESSLEYLLDGSDEGRMIMDIE